MGSLVNCRGEAAETSHNMNMKGPGSDVSQLDSAPGTIMTYISLKDTVCLMARATQKVQICDNICNNNT